MTSTTSESIKGVRASGAHWRSWVCAFGAHLICACLLSWGTESAFCQNRVPILIDTAAGTQFSDLITIIHAARSPALELVGITTVGHNTVESAQAIRHLLQSISRQDVLVAAGAETGQLPLESWTKWLLDKDNLRSPIDPQPAETTTGNLSATSLFTELCKKHQDNLVVIATGPLSNVGAALKTDAEIAHRVKRIYLTNVNCTGEQVPAFIADPEAAQVVLSTTIPITLLDEKITQDLVLTKNRLLQIAQCHTLLTDSLCRLVSGLKGPLFEGDQEVYLPGSLAVACCNSPAYTLVETRRFQYQEGHLDDSQELSSREFQVVVQTQPATVMREVVSRIRDINLDFATTFAHFILSLNQLGKEALLKVQQSLQGGVPVPEPPKGKLGSEAFQVQALAYLNWYIDLLRILDDPVAREQLQRFEKTILQVAGIGWWFPPTFYTRWMYERTPGQPLSTAFGVANPVGEKLENVQGSITYGDQTESGQVTATTREVRFELVVQPPKGSVSPPEYAEIQVNFTYRGFPISLKDRISVVPHPSVKVTALRCLPKTIEVETVSWSQIHLSAVPFSAVPTSPPVAVKTISSVLGPVWTPLEIASFQATPQTGETDSPRELCLHLTQDPGTNPSNQTITALVPSVSETVLLEPRGPSNSPCRPVSKKGLWGWSTDYVAGSGCLEYKVLDSPQVNSSTEGYYLVMDYFSEGDDLDTFRIEGATGTTQYAPATAWMTKPEDRGWQHDRFRISPMVEEMIKGNQLRWLRIHSGNDGEEVVRRIRIE